MPRYNWNTAKCGIKHQSMKETIKNQNEQLPLTSDHWKTQKMQHGAGNPGPGLGQVHNCGRVKLVNISTYTLYCCHCYFYENGISQYFFSLF